jgi:hypothetical protein
MMRSATLIGVYTFVLGFGWAVARDNAPPPLLVDVKVGRR